MSQKAKTRIKKIKKQQKQQKTVIKYLKMSVFT